MPIAFAGNVTYIHTELTFVLYSKYDIMILYIYLTIVTTEDK